MNNSVHHQSPTWGAVPRPRMPSTVGASLAWMLYRQSTAPCPCNFDEVGFSPLPGTRTVRVIGPLNLDRRRLVTATSYSALDTLHIPWTAL